jgi:hypothetical protein
MTVNTNSLVDLHDIITYAWNKFNRVFNLGELRLLEHNSMSIGKHVSEGIAASMFRCREFKKKWF